MSTQIYIYGAGGFGREVNWLAHSLQDTYSVAGFIDDNKAIDNCAGLPVMHSVPENSACVIAVANTISKKTIAQRYPNTTYINLVHPHAELGAGFTMGAGNIICKGVTCTVGIQLGNHVIINLHSTIGHDAVIADYVSIMPGVHISGNVRIGEGALIGTGAVILPGLTIGKWSKVGAGAVITKDVPDNAVVVGVPGRVVKRE